MAEMICPNCHKEISAGEQAAFCPFCGRKLTASGVDLSAVLAEPDPVKKHERLLALQAEYPDNLAIAEELLHLGRLYERGKRGVDFSVIKCYVLNVYLEPDAWKKEKREALRYEIFHHPDLDKCLKLCDDQEVFMRRYLERLSEEFIRLFLQGSSQYMRSFFGYVNHAKAPKYLAMPVAGMLRAMQMDESLSAEQRMLLMRAFYTAFAHRLQGETSYLDDALAQYDIHIDL